MWHGTCVAVIVELAEVRVDLVGRGGEARFQELMEAHHYLGLAPKIGETLWYAASYCGAWVALLSFSASAWKCGARDRWIGWDFRHRYDRLQLVTNNSRFLILPDWHYPNLGSKVLALCERRLAADWQKMFAHPLLLLETFVDPARFRGTVYQAANWTYVGDSKGYGRIGAGYSAHQSPKMLFVKSLRADARSILSQPVLDPAYRRGVPKIMLTAEQMCTLPGYFADISDHRQAKGRRHPLRAVLALAAAATLAGARGYREMAEFAADLSQTIRRRLGCRFDKGKYLVPSMTVIWDCLVSVDPVQLDRSLQRWNADHGREDSCLAIDGKTMKNAIDDEGRQTHILGVVGHQTGLCHTQKKSVCCL
jgi:hypothetical protein